MITYSSGPPEVAELPRPPEPALRDHPQALGQPLAGDFVFVKTSTDKTIDPEIYLTSDDDEAIKQMESARRAFAEARSKRLALKQHLIAKYARDNVARPRPESASRPGPK